VHVFTVNVVAPYTDIYTKKWRQISYASLLERHVRESKQSYIDFGDNFNFGKLVCRRVGLSASWLSANWIVGELVCRRVVQLPPLLRATWCETKYYTSHQYWP